MARERKTKNVMYKRVVLFNKRHSLKQLLDRALRKRNTVGKRKRNVSNDPGGQEWEVLGDTESEKGGFTFGTLMIYTPGTHPLFLVDDDSAEKITLEKYKTPATKDGKRRELLDSVLFFGVVDNHMVVMQSQALRSRHLEEYLGWLIREADVTDKTNYFQLVDTPPKAVRDRFTKNPKVRSIKVGTELLPPDEESGAEDETTTTNVALNGGSSGDKLGVLLGLLQPTDIAKLPIADLANANIELSLTIRYNTKTTEKGQKLMDQLGSAFRNTEDVDLEIGLLGGGTISGSDLKLSGPVRITTYDGQPAASEVYRVMREWLQEKIESQDVQAS